MKRDYNIITAIVFDDDNSIEYVNCNYMPLYCKFSDGVRSYYTYDDIGNNVYTRDSNGIEYYYYYDNYGNMIYSEDTNGTKYWNTYNKNHNLIYSKVIDDDLGHYEFWYDENGNVIKER